jgi:nicotinamidase-related amidase
MANTTSSSSVREKAVLLVIDMQNDFVREGATLSMIGRVFSTNEILEEIEIGEEIIKH